MFYKYYVPDFAEKIKNTSNYTSHLIEEQHISLWHNYTWNIEIRDGIFDVMCDEARLVKSTY